MTDLSDRAWRSIPEQRQSGAMAMALDEIAAETAVRDGRRTVRVYTWEPSTLSLGYGQAPGSVDWEFCDRGGIDVTRRQTGGGGIYHDIHGDISYSIVLPADDVPGDLMETYELLCEPIFDAFDRMGVSAAFADDEHPEIHRPACYLRAIDPAHDILVDGQKISGNAQYRQRDAVIQHGSLSFDLDPEPHLGVFSNPGTSPEEFEERVTAISEHADISRETAVGHLEDALREWADAEDGEWTAAEREDAESLVAQKYSAEAWVRDRVEPEED
ncbi:biotin/lipoate A/B protein ligase family protein [Natronoarchaeum sp. GCM10025703]|uniref:lipoate--protein ligase family protein n=1 Tax=unclassified Natronoarchaeum TaxID=2620183 RepID=UPI00361674AD